MARRLDELYYDITARTQGFTRGLTSAQGGLRGFVGKVGGGTGALAAFGAAAVAAGIKATRMAAQLDSSLREVSTLLPGTVENVGRLREQIIQLSTEVPQPPEMLSRGLYQVISAGITDTAEAMEVLGVSARAAVAGLTDTFTSVDAITTVLNAYQLETSEAARVSDVFFNTIKEGKLQFGDIAANIGSVATSAALAGVSIEEVSAALATLTKFGINSSEAAVSLNRLFLSLTNTQDDATAAAKRMGVELSTTALRSKGLVGFLQDLQGATDGNIDKLAELIPEIRAARGVFVLAGNGAEEYGRILAGMSESGGSAGDAFNKMNGSLSNQATILKNQLNQAWLNLGASILPLVLAALEGVNRLLESDTETTVRLLRALGRESAAATLEAQAAEQGLADSIEDNTRKIERSLRERARLVGLVSQRGGEGLEAQSALARGATAPLENVVDQFRILPDLVGRTSDEQEAMLESAVAYANEIRESVRLTGDQQLALAKVEALNVSLLGLIQQQNLLQQEAQGPSDREERIQSEISALRERATILSAAGEAEAENVAQIRTSIALRENELAAIRASADLASAQSEAFARSAEEAQEQARHARRSAAATTGAERERFLQQAEAFDNTQRALQRVADLERARAGIGREITEGLREQTSIITDLRAELQSVVDLLNDPDLLEAFDLEAQIDAARGAVDRLREAFQFAREGFPGLVEDPGVDIAASTAARQAELASRAIEKIGRESENWADALRDAEGVLQAMGVGLDDLHPITRAIVEEWIELRGKVEETDDSIREIINDVSFAARGAIELANAFGLVGDEAAAAVNQVALIGEGIGRIAAGDLLGGLGGVASGIAGVVGSIAGPSQSERELIDSQREVARRLDQLTSRLDILADALRGLPGGLSQSIADALRGPIAGLAGTDFERGGTTTELVTASEAALSIERALRNAGISASEIEQAADAFGLPADQLLRLLEGESLNTAQLREAIGQAEGLFDLLDRGLSDVLDTVRGRLDLLRDSFDILDIDEPTEQLRLIARELERAGTALSAADIERLAAGDEEFIEALFNELRSGTGRFTQIGAFGELSFDEFLDILRQMEGIQDRIADGVEGEDGDFQNVSAINRATVEQGDSMIALLGSQNFFLEDIRNRLRDGIPVITVTDTMLAAASTVRIEHSGRIDVSVTGDAVDAEGAAIIRDGLIDSLALNRDMGEQLRRQRAGLGLPPSRTQ